MITKAVLLLVAGCFVSAQAIRPTVADKFAPVKHQFCSDYDPHKDQFAKCIAEWNERRIEKYVRDSTAHSLWTLVMARGADTVLAKLSHD